MYANVYENRNLLDGNVDNTLFQYSRSNGEVLEKPIEQPFADINFFDADGKNTSIVDMYFNQRYNM